jgi:hypothetical protein
MQIKKKIRDKGKTEIVEEIQSNSDDFITSSNSAEYYNQLLFPESQVGLRNNFVHYVE